MSSIFGKPNIPTPQQPAPTPTIDQAAQNTDQADRLRRRRGAAATILVPGQTNSLGAPPSAAAAILGT